MVVHLIQWLAAIIEVGMWLFTLSYGLVTVTEVGMVLFALSNG